MNRWQQKAAALAAGWRDRFGVEPSTATVALALSVAQHETRCGDAWPGEHNWGAVQRRSLNTFERGSLSAIKPHPDNVGQARAKLDADGWLADPICRACGEPRRVLPPATSCDKCNGTEFVERGALHVDSSPGKGYYWVYFWRFVDDAAGANFFVKILAADRASCRAVLETGGTPHALARAMYMTRYYEGFYKRASYYERNEKGRWVEVPTNGPGAMAGSELNISSYGGALALLVPEIRTGMSTAPAPAPRPLLKRGSRGAAVVEWQKIIGVVEDGIFGRITESVTMLWQQSNHLKADGIVGPQTWAAGLAL